MNDVSPYLKRPLRSEADMIACERDRLKEQVTKLAEHLDKTVNVAADAVRRAMFSEASRDHLKEVNAELLTVLTKLMAEIKAEMYIGPKHPVGIKALALIAKAKL